MRTAILAGLALLAWAIAPGGATAAAAEPPYPPSDAVAGIAWDPASYASGGAGGDIWPVTWGADGRLYTAWGDGAMPGCRAKVSYGVAALPGGPGADLGVTGCGPFGMKRGKIGSLLAVDGALYAVVNLQNRAWPRPDFAVWWSYDNGASWQEPGWAFSGRKGKMRPDSFVNFGQGYAGARDGYVYLTAQRAVPDTTQGQAYLARVPRGLLGRQEAYEYYAGAGEGGVPAWAGDPEAALPVFEDPAGVGGPNIAFDAGLGRYLLTAGHGDGGRLGVFEGPEPWGPWRTVGYEDDWLGIRGGDYLGVRFPTKWMADGGTTLWAVFSCYGKAGCGRYHDRYNLVRATLALTPSGATAASRGRTAASSARAAVAGSASPSARRRTR